MSNMENIVFETIETDSTHYKFGYGYYGHPDDPSSFKLVIMAGNTGEYAKFNGYVCGPKMYAQSLTSTGKAKEFKHWLANKGSKSKIAALETILVGIPATTEVEVAGTGNNNLVSGTYIHPDLVLAVATSMSNEFYFQASKIVREHSIKHRLVMKDLELQENTVTITRLERMILEMEEARLS